MKPINRKIRKLKNNPKLFFKDFLKNKKKKLINNFYKIAPKKYSKNKKFTIISAVYNVGDYLDEFIISLENQRLDFRTNINIIFVDDGSKDNSKEIINKWIKKYPSNIFYIYKENGGQASARNLGLEYIKTEWVTFIDPDDFLDVNYFYLINKNIESEENVGAVITKFKLFKEKFGTFHDGFQTDFCFTKPIRILNSKNLEDCVQFSSSSSVYRTDIIQKNNIRFDHKLTASFEDTKYFYEYLYHLPESKVIYVKDALYYYRLRASENSSSNNQWKKKAKYIEFFKNGLLETVNLFKDHNNKIPNFIQRLVLFSIIPYLQVGMINRNRIENVLNEKEKELLLEYITESLSFVENKTIEEFYNSPGNFFWISAILNYFRNEQPNEIRVYINKVDIENNLIYFRSYGKKNSKNELYIDNQKLEAVSERKISYNLFEKELITEFNSCYKIEENTLQKIMFKINDRPTKIYTDFKVMLPNDTNIYEGYHKKLNSFKDILIFVDSGYKADDNAEHLYRNWYKNGYLKNKEAYYLLDRNSSHWNKLLLEGFNLVDINSLRCIKILKEAKYIFSSYLPGHLNQWVKNHSFKFQKFIFLQHGVVTSNLSKPFNASYSQISKMVISTTFEKEEILTDKFNYIFHENDLIYSGIPRLDNLFSKSKNIKIHKKGAKHILICPTWRTSLSLLNLSLERNVNDFFNSEYIQKWVTLLNNKHLSELINKQKIKITFCMHQELFSLLEQNELEQRFINLIENKNITIINPREINYQELFLNNDVLITDFSSLHFDFASLNKPVIYYQFDKDSFYGVSHSYQKGIFDFNEHGFGPVLVEQEQVIKYIREYLSQGSKRFKNFSNRYKSIYLHTDGQSSEIIFNTIFKGTQNEQ